MVRSPAPANKPPCAAFQSHPSDLELVNSYLRPWVANGLKAGTFIHEADVYAADPAELTRRFTPAVAQDGERAWYFYTPLRHKTGRGKRKARTVATGDGCWHNEAKSKPLITGIEEKRQVGYRQSFSFVKKENGARVRTGWLMIELRLLKDDAGREAPEEAPLGNLVLCKVYRSPRNPGPSDGEPAAAAPPGTKAAADDGESSAATAGTKGTADDDDEISDASLAAAASGRKTKSEGSKPSEATAALPGGHRKPDDETSGADTAVAAPGRKEKAADGEDSAETSAAAPERKRKSPDDESSVAAAAPARKRKADGGSAPAPTTEMQCPQCGAHLVVTAKSKPETKSETEIARGASDAPRGGETRASSEKNPRFHQFL